MEISSCSVCGSMDVVAIKCCSGVLHKENFDMIQEEKIMAICRDCKAITILASVEFLISQSIKHL
jgi:hypothetical protein